MQAELRRHDSLGNHSAVWLQQAQDLPATCRRPAYKWHAWRLQRKLAAAAYYVHAGMRALNPEDRLLSSEETRRLPDARLCVLHATNCVIACQNSAAAGNRFKSVPQSDPTPLISSLPCTPNFSVNWPDGRQAQRLELINSMNETSMCILQACGHAPAWTHRPCRHVQAAGGHGGHRCLPAIAPPQSSRTETSWSRCSLPSRAAGRGCCARTLRPAPAAAQKVFAQD